MEEASRWVRRCCCCYKKEEESEENRGEPEEEVKIEEVCLRKSGSSLSLPPAQLEESNTPQPHWFHTLQVRRHRGRRGRSNSDPLRENSCQDPVSWKPALQFGAAHSYVSLEKLGEGAYASVYKGISRINGQLVALKVIRMKTEEGIPFTAIREASLLKRLKHANIVILHDIIHTSESLTFVFEYVQTDLAQYMSQHPGGLHSHNVRIFLFQLVRALSYIHSRRILHRDLKPQNLLISYLGELKLADFGKEAPPTDIMKLRPPGNIPNKLLLRLPSNLNNDRSLIEACSDRAQEIVSSLEKQGLARSKSIPSHTFSSEVVTLWYRPPDVLLGSTDYSTALDIWGAGCIFVEMLQGAPAFPGEAAELEQLQTIWEVLGMPSEDSWPGISQLPNYKPEWFVHSEQKPFKTVWKRLNQLPNRTEDLAQKMLKMVPGERISAQDALQHPYFSTLPPPIMHLRDTVSIFKVPGVYLETEVRDIFNPGRRVKRMLLPASKFW